VLKESKHVGVLKFQLQYRAFGWLLYQKNTSTVVTSQYVEHSCWEYTPFMAHTWAWEEGLNLK
jgi:hypothetical protein